MIETLTRVVSGDLVVGWVGPTVVVTAAVGRMRGVGAVAIVGEEDEQSEAHDLEDEDEDAEFRALRSHGVGARCSGHRSAVLSGRCDVCPCPWRGGCGRVARWLLGELLLSVLRCHYEQTPLAVKGEGRRHVRCRSVGHTY